VSVIHRDGDELGSSFVAVDFSEEIRTLRATMDSVREVTDLETLRSRIADLEK
jgi:peptide chain release factor 2